MGNEFPNNDDPPASFPLPMDEMFGSNTGLSEAEDSSGIIHNGNGARPYQNLSIQHSQLPGSSFHMGIAHGAPHFNNNEASLTGLDLLTNATQSSGFLNPQIDHNFNDGNNPFVDRLMPGYPWLLGGRVKENSESVMDDSRVNVNNLVGGATHLNNFQYPHFGQNFATIKGDGARGIHMTRQGGETNSSIHRLEMSTNFASCGTNMPALYHTPNSRVPRFNVNNSVQSDCQEKMDGRFLTLGIGDSKEAVPEFSVTSGENTRGSEWANFLQQDTSVGLPAIQSSLNPGHDLPGGFSSFQNNVGGWTPSNNNQGFIPVNYGSRASPSQILQAQQVDKRHCFPVPTNTGLVLGGSRGAQSTSMSAYKGFQNYLSATSTPVHASQDGLFDYGQVRLPRLTSESANTTRSIPHPQQSADQLQKRLKTIRNLPEPSMLSPFIRIQEGSTRKDQSGQPFPGSESNPIQVVEADMFPRRLGVPLARGNLVRPQDSGSLQHFKNIPRPAFPTDQEIPVARGNELLKASSGLAGPPHRAKSIHLPPSNAAAFLNQVIPAAKGNAHIQASDVLFGQSLKKSSSQTPPLNSANFQNSVPLQNLPGYTTGLVIPAANAINEASQAYSSHVVSSLKRSAIRPPRAIPVVQRRKTTRLPSIRPSVPVAAQVIPPNLAARYPELQAQTALAHLIKRKDSPPPQPSGQKCELCKRDLLFTPDGPVQQPTNPPHVAILPCGHVFHDHCLQLITPEDQSRLPPCIPCAIGES